ncbi:MAG: hypothetical protein FD176_1565 [Rhodospirillaceae bacterium]|nr:MAG: hypothetical protein FD176_1565 [Rhodospirillaceae bacterium]TNC96691.1 MAG: hypothetical protein FD119_1576 [Stygiobacter sp.]
MAYPNYGQTPYNSVPQPGNPRQTEAWALTEAARRMSLAQKEGASSDDLLVAVRLNWRLWTIFQAELSGEESALPDQMRLDMLSLCNFIDRRSVDIIAEPLPAKLDVLININRQIAAGLFSTPTEGAAAGEGEANPAAITGTNDVV